MKHKYVRTQLGFIIWPMTNDVFHTHISRRYDASGVPISAGFAAIANGNVYCYGRSESLNLGSLPDDSIALASQLGLTPAVDGTSQGD